jgi:nitrite reductase/ring-hydroxylating ferredoxin subunit
MSTQHQYVCLSEELGEGQRRLVKAGGRTYGVFRLDGNLLAYLNECPHQGGPVCEGLLVHKVVEVVDEQRRHVADDFDPDCLNIVCAWHGWEFDVRTGLSSGDGMWRLRAADVSESDGRVYLGVPDRTGSQS